MRRIAVLLSSVGIFAAFSPFAQATVIRDMSNYDSVMQGLASGYTSVGKLLMQQGGSGYIGSGVLLSSQWVLTAAHCVEDMTSMTFTIGGTVYSADSWMYHPSWDGDDLGNGYDLGLVHLSTPVSGIDTAVLYAGTTDSLLGLTATYVGYGNIGQGSTGAISGTYGTKHAVQNVIDTTLHAYNPSYPSTTILMSDFDQPDRPSKSKTGDPIPLEYEGLIAGGDSGGGAFVTVDGITYLAGVHSFGMANQTVRSKYGELSGSTSVSAFLDWITANTGVGLASLAAGGNWRNSSTWAGGNIPDAVAEHPSIGYGFNSTVLCQQGDNYNIAGLNIGNHAYGHGGILNMTGGALTVGAGGSTSDYWFIVGKSANAESVDGELVYSTFNQSGGTLICHSQAHVGLEFLNGSRAVWNLSGTGAVQIDGEFNIGLLRGVDGSSTKTGGDCTFNQSDSGTNVAANSGLFIGSDSSHVGGNSTYNLNGGTLTTPRIQGRAYGNNTFVFNGGAVVASASTDEFVDNLTHAYVAAGGAKFDTAGYDVAIPQLLETDPDSPGSGLTKTGNGVLVLNGANTYTGRTTVMAGTLQLGPSAHDAVLGLGGADIQAADAMLVFDYTGGSSPASTVKSLLAESYAADWDDGQFLCSIADSSHGLGWIDYAGDKELTVQYALYGDANLDGAVDLGDLSILGQHWRSSDSVWAMGDFNYDGAVDLSDLTLLGQNWRSELVGMSLNESLSSLGMTAVPEPGAMALLLAAALALAAKPLARRKLGRSGTF